MTTPKQAADILFNVATILEQAEDNPYHIRAYRRAARLLLRTPADALPFDANGHLDVPGLGPKLAAKLGELFNPNQPREEIAS